VASEIRQGVFSELESQALSLDRTQRSTGLSSQAATAKLQSTINIGNATGRGIGRKVMASIVPFAFGLGI